MAEIDSLRSKVESGEICAGLGATADEICNRALEQFSSEAPDAGDDPEREGVFDEKVFNGRPRILLFVRHTWRAYLIRPLLMHQTKG
jgi:hypothetical protein